MNLKSLFLLVACLVAGSKAACDTTALTTCATTYTTDLAALAVDNSDLCTRYTASQTCINTACADDDGTLKTPALTALDTAYTTASMDFSGCAGASGTCDSTAVAACIATSTTDLVALLLDSSDLCTKYQASETCINAACTDADATVTESSMSTINTAYTAASLDYSTCSGGSGATGLKATATILHLAAMLLLIFHLS